MHFEPLCGLALVALAAPKFGLITHAKYIYIYAEREYNFSSSSFNYTNKY